jgi:hypothetical protein
VYSCYLICIRKKNASGFDIKGYIFDDYLAVLASGGIYIYSFVLLISHNLDFLPDMNRFIKSMGIRWVVDLARMAEIEMHAVVLFGNLKEGDHL